MPHLRTLLAGLLAVTAAWAGERPTLARLLPPDTPVFFEALTPSLEEQKEQAVYKALEEPALKQALERIFGEESDLTARTIPLGPAGVVLRPDMKGGVIVKYVDAKGERTLSFQEHFALAWIGMAPAKIPVDLVVAVKVESDPREAVETLRRIFAAAYLNERKEKRGDIDAAIAKLFVTGRHREVEYSTFDWKGFRIHLTALGPFLLVATTEDRVKDCIDRHLNGGKDSLADDPRHVALKTRAQGTGTHTTFFSVHLDRGFNAAGTTWPMPVGMARQVLQGLGLDSVKGVATVARVDGTGVTSTISVLTEGELRGTARLFEGGKPASFGCLEFAPKDTLYVACSNFSPSRLLDIAVGAGLADQAAQLGAVFQMQFGMRLREDLLDLVGPEGAIIVAPNHGLIPDIGIVLESEDPERLVASLLRLAEALPWPAGHGVSHTKIGGYPAHIAPLGHPRLAEIPVAPTFGVVDGRVLITLYPLGFQRFAAVKRGDRPSLAANRDFVGLRSRVPKDALGISYLNLRRVTAWAYDTFIPIMQSLPQYEGSTPLFELPDVDLITRHLYGRVGWRVADERGMHWVSHSPVDLSGFVLAALAGAGTVLYLVEGAKAVPVQPPPPPEPPLHVGRGRDREARVCRSRVRLLRARIQLYAQEHSGAYPESLEKVRAPWVAQETFVSPGAEKAYVYFGPEGRGAVLLHGHPNGKDGRICLLTMDLKMERVTAAELSERLQGKPGGRGAR